MKELAFLPLAVLCATPLAAQDVCEGFGPQTPRDISVTEGANTAPFTLAPAADQMYLCNIHTHTNAEHKSPRFSISAGDGDHGGWKCNDTDTLTEAELTDPANGHGGFHGVAPGDTIEVHWVYTSCAVEPGKGLGSCASETCLNPELRVESQVFLVVNDENAIDFADFAYGGHRVDGRPQPRALPADTGTPVVFAGSTTGTSYDNQTCSPYQVTWSVRPRCAKLDINSLYAWGANGNVFEEDHSHGVRPLVTDPALLAPIR